MHITFGICLSQDENEERLQTILQSIKLQRWDPFWDSYEVIMIGGRKPNIEFTNNIRHIEFDESVKPAWITKKKNIIAQEAQFSNLVISHDYYMFEPEWFTGMKAFDNREHWEVMVHRMFTLEGHRHSDWMIAPQHMADFLNTIPGMAEELMRVAPYENHPIYVCGVPYDVPDLAHLQYVNGAYFICKRQVLIDVPQNEDLVWGNPEDVWWGQQLAAYGCIMKFNPFSSARSLKPNKWHLHEIPYHIVQEMRRQQGRFL